MADEDVRGTALFARLQARGMRVPRHHAIAEEAFIEHVSLLAAPLAPPR
jgi:hypothetical protein